MACQLGKLEDIHIYYQLQKEKCLDNLRHILPLRLYHYLYIQLYKNNPSQSDSALHIDKNLSR